MPCRLRLSCGTLALFLTGCFNPDEDDSKVDIPNTDGQDSADETGTTGGTNDPTTGISTTDDTDDTNEPDDTDEGQTTDDETDGDTDSDPVCGDGTVNGDEVCDDGVNDGSYGSCLEDCSGLAEHCGDGIVNGDEVCDDGRNDNSYGGCSDDCQALGPFCGDGVVQDDHEMCDNGDENENASGCNVDCVVSGTQLYTWLSDPYVGDGYTCGGEITWPVLRDDGSVRFAAREWCNSSQFLIELTPELEEVDISQALFPAFPSRATVRGDDWLLSSHSCDYSIAEGGTLTEVCDSDRISGSAALQAWDDEFYLTMRNGIVARYGAGSPALNDSPLWEVTAPANTASSFYSLSHATLGNLGAVVAVGYYRQGSQSPYTYYGYLRRWTSGGNLQTSRTYSEMQFTSEIVATPDGGFVLRGSGNAAHLMKINSNLNHVWSKTVAEIDNCSWLAHIVTDSVGDIIIDCEDGWPQRTLIKLDPDGNERWNVALENEGFGRMVVDPDDWIIRTSLDGADYYSNEDTRFRVDKIAP